MAEPNFNRLQISRQNYSSLPRRSLLVCATLVQNPANLGGLCRTAEIFRLDAVVVADLSLAQTAAFKNVAASAHHWQPILACPSTALKDWILHQKQAGYCAIALHLSPDAISLPDFVYPKKSVLVLGRELTGIPDDVAALCDCAIAIPQAGMVESLNVQTAAAIAIYEYARQHPLPEGTLS